MTRITALRVFARWWIDVYIVLIAMGAFGIALNGGIGRIIEVLNPFNVFNILAIIVLASPALIASRWAKRLENADLLGEDDALPAERKALSESESANSVE